MSQTVENKFLQDVLLHFLYDVFHVTVSIKKLCFPISEFLWGGTNKCNFFEDTHPVQAATAFKLAHCCLDNKTTLNFQHIRGKTNYVVDDLSCQHHLNDLQLTKFCLDNYFLRAPTGFRICPLPPEVISWTSSTIAAWTVAQSQEAKSTAVKRNQNWLRRIEYLESLGIRSDPFLDNFSRPEQEDLAIHPGGNNHRHNP
jgi:hypothetical protein